MSRSRVKAGGARASYMWQPISSDRWGKGGGRGTTGVKAATRGSGISAPMMGHTGEYSCALVMCWGSGVDLMRR